jgi:molecular chaperone GrpE (heat shock protein)
MLNNNHFDNHHNHHDNHFDNHHNHLNNHTQNNDKTYNCNKCQKSFTKYQNRWRHEKNCKENDKIIDELKNKVQEMQNQLVNLLNDKAKIHPKTLQKINKQLMNNCNNTNNGIINNGPVINNTFVKFGKVELSKVLTEKQILSILNKPFMSLEETIKLIHFNDKLPEYNQTS